MEGEPAAQGDTPKPEREDADPRNHVSPRSKARRKKKVPAAVVEAQKSLQVLEAAYTEKLAASASKIASLEQQLSDSQSGKAKDEVAHVRSQLKRCRAKLKSTSSRMKALKAQVSSLQAGAVQQSNVTQLKRQLRQANEEVQRLRATAASSSSAKPGSDATAAAVRQLVRTVPDDVAASDARIASLRRRLGEVEATSAGSDQAARLHNELMLVLGEKASALEGVARSVFRVVFPSATMPGGSGGSGAASGGSSGLTTSAPASPAFALRSRSRSPLSRASSSMASPALDGAVVASLGRLMAGTTKAIRLNSVRSVRLGPGSVRRRGAAAAWKALGTSLKVNSTIVMLDLSGSALGNQGLRSLASGLRDNASLEHLTLDACELYGGTALSALSGALPHLQALSLSRNALGPEGAKALAHVLHGLSSASLSVLLLEHCALGPKGVAQLVGTAFQPGAAWLASLSVLSIAGNNVRSKGAAAVAEALTRCADDVSALTTLSVDNNGIREAGMHALLGAPLVASSLAELNVSRNPAFGAASAALASLCKVVRQSSTLRVLSLVGCDLGPAQLATLSPALGQAKEQLEQVDLWGNSLLGTPGITTLASSCVAKNGHLTVLGLRGVGCGAKGVSALCNALRDSKLHRLANLDVSGNGLGPAGARALASALADPGFAPALTTLNASANNFGTEGSVALFEALAKNASLTQLHLALNYVDDGAMEALATLVCQGTPLTHLSLAWNHVGVRGLRGLSPGLVAPTARLESLDLEGNKVGGEGMRLLQAALAECPSITELNVGANNLRTEGARALAHLLGSSESRLAHVVAKRNGIDAAGFLALASALKASSCIRHLDLSGNKGDDKAAYALAEMIKLSTTLETVDVTQNPISSAGVASLSAATQRNQGVQCHLPTPIDMLDDDDEEDDGGVGANGDSDGDGDDEEDPPSLVAPPSRLTVSGATPPRITVAPADAEHSDHSDAPEDEEEESDSAEE